MKEDAGTQVEHLLSHLSRARERRGRQFLTKERKASGAVGAAVDSDGDRGGSGDVGESRRWNAYQHVYHPAMSMQDKSKPGQRVEEGVLVLSKLPIVHSSTLLLPRNFRDNSDDHQRAVLKVQVQVQVTEATEVSEGGVEVEAEGKGEAYTAEGAVERSTTMVLVDVLTTHLSLSEEARNLSVERIAQWCLCDEAPSDKTWWSIGEPSDGYHSDKTATRTATQANIDEHTDYHTDYHTGYKENRPNRPRPPTLHRPSDVQIITGGNKRPLLYRL